MKALDTVSKIVSFFLCMAVLLVVVIISALSSVNAKNVVVRDCLMMQKFHHHGKVYECKLLEGKKTNE